MRGYLEYNMKEDKLYEFLKECVNHDGLPIMDTNLFGHVTEMYGKEVFRKVLAEFITKEKPPFPYKEFTYEDLVTSFRKLKKVD